MSQARSQTARRRVMGWLAIVTSAGSLVACGGNSGNNTSAGFDTDCRKLDPNVTLTIMNAGGVESEAITKGYIKPFTERTGIKVELDPPNKLGRIQAEVESGDVMHDIFTTESTTLKQGIAQDLFEKIHYNDVNMSPSTPESLGEYGFGWQYYSTIMAWRKDAIPHGQEPPSTWADFFNTDKYPGRRAMPNYPAFAVPIALLADGVPPNQLYPLDVDRALDFLEAHKDDIDVWWDAGAQPPQLLSSGELDYSVAWSGRVVALSDELGVEYTYDDGLLDLAYAGIVKGTPNYCEALAFIEALSKPKNQAVAAEVLPYTGGAKNPDKYLPKDKLDLFPTSGDNRKKQVLSDAQWWYEHGEEVQKRWDEFVLTR